MDEEILRAFWKRCMFGFCRGMFSADLGHRNAEEVMARTWREFGGFTARIISTGEEDPTPDTAAEFDMELAKLLGADATKLAKGPDEIVTRWDFCPLWEEMKDQRLEKAFICVGACNKLSAELAKAAGEDVSFERGNELPRGGACEKIWTRKVS